jgi:hypothetical protein
MWKISATRWLNPLAITYVEDDAQTHTIRVYLISGAADNQAPIHVSFWKEDRLAVLAHLARNSTPVVPSDADLSGWPYDEEATP